MHGSNLRKRNYEMDIIDWFLWLLVSIGLALLDPVVNQNIDLPS